MANTAFLLSGVVMGLLLLAVVVALRSHGWREYSPPVESPRRALTRVTRSPTAWMVVFLVLVLGTAGGAVLFVTAEVPQSAQQLGGALVVALTVLALAGYLFAGVHRSTRSKGLGNAQATAAGLFALGALFLVAVAATLVGII